MKKLLLLILLVASCAGCAWDIPAELYTHGTTVPSVPPSTHIDDPTP